ncbi:hypothetical protein C1O33_01210 [Staphylococcus schleiferi]|uniref:hypothetical protein n=1 Tax=Staphylococcus sp. 191 TaxID=2070016 RepID=UPI0013F3A7C9|nr:hypothetical protein [Staphylococcus sp. 191]NHA35379.1 hypothetical protein [Staphylococcus schleiferi]NHB71062.1 hypothetical protein [Staphylococcus sp. 191]
MLSKQSEDFLVKLRVELLFRGKKEEEIEEIEEELRDHLATAEQQGEDVQAIIDMPIKAYADKFSKHLPFINHLTKYVAYFVLFLLALFTIPDLFEQSYTLTASDILNVIFTFLITVILGLYMIRKLILTFGDSKKTYIFAAIGGILIFGLILFGAFLAHTFPLYEIVTLTQQQSNITGVILLLLVMLICVVLKQKIYAVILFLVCLPNIVALLTTQNSSRTQYLTISLSLFIVLNIAFMGFAFYQFRKDSKTK